MRFASKRNCKFRDGYYGGLAGSRLGPLFFRDTVPSLESFAPLFSKNSYIPL